MFLCLGCSLARDASREQDGLAWLLALVSGLFGIGIAAFCLQRIYRPSPRSAPFVGRDALRTPMLWLGIGVGAAIPWAIWLVDVNVVRTVDAITRSHGVAGPLLDVGLAYAMLVGLTRPVVADLRLVESLQMVPEAARRSLAMLPVGALIASMAASLVVVRAWDHVWIGASLPLFGPEVLYWWAPRLLAVACLVCLTGAVIWRRGTDAACD